MNAFFGKFSVKKLFFSLALVVISLFACTLSACQKTIDYFEYVSENRSNIFLCDTNDFSLRIYATEKESPYEANGIPCEISPRAEIYLTAPSGVENYTISFMVNGEKQGGELSFDNVKAEYYYFCTLDISTLNEIVCTLSWGKKSVELKALSVIQPQSITARTALQNVLDSERELFDTLTDKYGFLGEIYIRLIYEDSPYYYIGVIARSGNTYAFLLSAQSGKILAKRQS